MFKKEGVGGDQLRVKPSSIISRTLICLNSHSSSCLIRPIRALEHDINHKIIFRTIPDNLIFEYLVFFFENT